jgi:DNA-binding XRE family transcriptional regulator
MTEPRCVGVISEDFPLALDIINLADTIRLMDTDLADIWGARIQAARDALGLTQEQLAERLAVSQPTIVRWEKTGKVPVEKLPALRRELGISWADLDPEAA